MIYCMASLLFLIFITSGVYKYWFPEAWLTINHVEWKRDHQDHLILLSVSITNSYDSELKDFTVSCETKGASGTVIGAVKTIVYSSVEPSKSIFVPTIDTGAISPQTATVVCRIADARHIK